MHTQTLVRIHLHYNFDEDCKIHNQDDTAMIPKRQFCKLLSFWILSIFVLLSIIEISLRLAGYPKGLFESKYPPNSRIEMTWGVIPYTVETNSLGLRGKDVAEKRGRERIRIMALGDSVTEGFYVDNQDTYPDVLERRLNELGYQADVINAGVGGISIDEEYALLRRLISLEPDLVVLTFATNDIADIRHKTREMLVDPTLNRKTRLITSLVNNTATGEALLDRYLTLRFASYKSSERDDIILKYGQERYQIEGGDEYVANVKEFEDRYAETDGIILTEPFSDEATESVSNYLFAFEHLNSFARSHGSCLVLVYFPSYSQVYDPTTSMRIRDILKKKTEELSVPFLDLTSAFRESGSNEVLHLAPLDYHLNPTGNRVMAEVIAEFLMNDILIGKNCGN